MNDRYYQITGLILLILGLTLIAIAAFPAEDRFNVHVIYFKPTDAGEIDRDYHDTILKDIQQYMQSEMTRHGYTDKTFPLDLDDGDKVKIHTVDGKHNSAFYDIDDHWDAFKSRIEPELPFRFNNVDNVASRDNVHLIILGGVKLKGNWRGAPAFGFTWHNGKWGGNALETMDRKNEFPNHYLAVIAHEMGHAFGFDPGHNTTPESFNGTVIAWGKTTAEWGDRMRIFKEEAALLDSRPIFRAMSLADETPPNKNEDLSMGTDDDVIEDKGDPIAVTAHNKLPTMWANIKRDYIR